MKLSRTAQVYLALALLVGFVLLSNLAYWGSTLQKRWNPVALGKDSVSDWESRFVDLKRALPPSGVAGYVSQDDIGILANPIDRNAEFALTQYTLVPHILQPGKNAPLVIGNFGGVELTGEQIAQKLGLTLVRNYGWGIYLFRSTP